MKQLPAKPQKTRDQLLAEFRKAPSDWRSDELMQNRAVMAQKVQLEWEIGGWFEWSRADVGKRESYTARMLDVLGAYPFGSVVYAMECLRSEKVRNWFDPIVIRDRIHARRSEALRDAPKPPEPKKPERVRVTPEQIDEIRKGFEGTEGVIAGVIKKFGKGFSE